MGDRRRAAETVEGERAAKVCAACGRTIAGRKKFAKNWDEVKFCSAGCRGHKPGLRDEALEAAILRLLAARGRDKTICPSEAARAVDGAGWEGLMEAARAAARRLVATGEIVITQGGRVVDGSTAKGPIRLRLR